MKIVALVLCTGISVPAWAQTSAPPAQAESRAAEIARKQEEKSKDLKPYVPGRVERVLANFEAGLLKPSRLGVNFGPMLPGAGMRLGLGYLHHTGDRTFVTVRGAYSLKNYKTITAQVVSPGHVNDHLDVEAVVGWRDAPQTTYYGVGNDSRAGNRTSFLLEETSAAGSARLRPTSWRPLSIGGEARLAKYSTGPGKGRRPSIETLFKGSGAPGFDSEPSYQVVTGEVRVDTRTGPGYSRTGSLLRGSYAVYDDRNGAQYDFTRTDLEAGQLIPILRENWVIALHAEMAMTDVERGAEVPLFMLPYLGSGSTLRAYRSFRFRDRHSLLFSGEFRWTPNEALDFAIFYDTGKVAAWRGDLNLDNLHSDWGIGARFHGLAFTGLRIELARGRDGMKLVISTSPPW